MIHQLRDSIKSIAFWGVIPDLSPVFAKRIILTNLLGLLFAVNMSVSALAFLYFDFFELAAFTFFFVLCEITWPILNRLKYYDVARIGLLISSNLLGFSVSVLLPSTGYNRGFYVMAGIPILLFSLKERKSIILGLLLPLFLYPLSEWAQYRIPVTLGLTPEVASLINYSVGMIYVILIFLMFYFLSRENARAEEKLEEQRARSFTSAKFAALGEMASGIAHEINNPMTAISLTTSTLKRVIGDEDIPLEEIQERLGVISRSVTRVVAIVEAMRNFSREAHKDPLKPESLTRIIEETLSFCTERFKNNDIEFDFVTPGDHQINCRAVQISQILLNLLNNAYDAVEELPVKWIRLEVHSLNDKVQISVTDSGSGIPESERENIFQPFYTTKPAGKGTGLGLSLSKKMIEEHRGVLALDHTASHTRFVIEIPY